MNNFWEEYLSSGNDSLDRFRLICLAGSLLSFPFLYLKIGILLTFLSIFLVGFFIYCFLKYLGFSEEESLKSSIFSVILVIFLYFFLILADFLLFLYFMCSIIFLFIQDWAYRFGHRLFHKDGFNKYIKDNIGKNHDTKKFIFAFISLLSYASMFISSSLFAYYNFDSQIYDNLRLQKIKISTNENIIEQIINNEFIIKMEIMNWYNTKKQAITSFQKLFGKAGVVFVAIGFFGFLFQMILGAFNPKGN